MRQQNKRGRQQHSLLFALNFFKHPMMLGALTPSSPYLVRRLLRHVDWSRVKVVVEYGPGVGTFTREVLTHMPEGARLIAIEMNPDFVRVLRKTVDDPRLSIVHGSAADVAEHLRAHGFDHADYVISGIPFSTMPEPIRAATLQATQAALEPDGKFLVYQYSGRVQRHLERFFGEVRGEREWLNVPPARTWVASTAPASAA